MWSRNILTCLIILLSYLYSIADLSNNSKVDSLLKDKDTYTIEYLLNYHKKIRLKVLIRLNLYYW